MQNTGTVYSSTERTPTVLPEMAELGVKRIVPRIHYVEPPSPKMLLYNQIGYLNYSSISEKDIQ